MADITALTLSEMINRATGGTGAHEEVHFFKRSTIGGATTPATINGAWYSMWLYDGSPGAAAAPPGAAAVPTRATAGALAQVNPSGGRQKWLTGMVVLPTQPVNLMLYDRLLHSGGLSGTVATPQVVGGTINRYVGASARGNQIFLEIYSDVGSTAQTVTASYTNQDGTAGQTTLTQIIGPNGWRQASAMLPLALASGDTGVLSVETVTLSGSTSVAGNFGITIARPLLYTCSDRHGVLALREGLTLFPGPKEIAMNACLALAYLPMTSVAAGINGTLYTLEV